MDQEHLFSLSPQEQPDGVAHVVPNVWLLTPEVDPPLLLSLGRTASLLGVDERAVARSLQRGELRGVRIEGATLVPSSELARYVANLKEVGQS